MADQEGKEECSRCNGSSNGFEDVDKTCTCTFVKLNNSSNFKTCCELVANGNGKLLCAKCCKGSSCVKEKCNSEGNFYTNKMFVCIEVEIIQGAQTANAAVPVPAVAKSKSPTTRNIVLATNTTTTCRRQTTTPKGKTVHQVTILMTAATHPRTTMGAVRRDRSPPAYSVRLRAPRSPVRTVAAN